MSDISTDDLNALMSDLGDITLDELDSEIQVVTDEPSTLAAPEPEDAGGGVEGPPSEAPPPATTPEPVTEPVAAEPTEPPPSADPAQPGFDPSLFVDLYRDTYGTDPTPEAVVEVLGVAQSLRALSTEQREAISRIVAGQPLTPPAAPPTQPPVVPATPAAPYAPTPTTQTQWVEPPPLPDYIDDDTRAYLEALRIQNEALRVQTEQAAAQAQQLTQAQYDAQVRAQREADATTIATAEQQWREANPEVSDADYTRISFKATSTPIYPQLLAQNGGDHTAATHALLNLTLQGLPDISNRVQNARIQAAADRAAADASRRGKLTSVSGGGTATPKSQPRSREERERAALTDLAAVFGDLLP